MTLPTHLLAGLILGKLTGNYPLSIVGSLFVDLDHLVSYAKNGVLSNPKKFWQTVTDTKDLYGDQRYYLHNFLVFIFLTGFVCFLNNEIGLIFGLAYLIHIILDALDNSDYYPFFPYKKINLHGPIRYFSKAELLLLCLLIIIFYLV